MARLNAKQFNIANGPQGTRWSDDLIKGDERWADQRERDFGRAYLHDVTRTHIAAEEGTTANTPYYPGQGGPGTQVQGKLFHDPKPVDAHRWPRGFTPERQSDVAATFKPWTGAYGGIANTRDEMVTNKAREAIARSSMPERDLSRLSRGYEESVEITTEVGGRNSGSYATSPGYPIAPRINLATDASANTVLHEVGHAMSDARGTSGHTRGVPRAAHWKEAQRQGGIIYGEVAGAEEARADSYANTHARTRTGEPHYKLTDYRPEGYDYYHSQSLAENAFAQEYALEHERLGVERPSQIAARLKREEQNSAVAEVRQQNAQNAGRLFTRPGKYEAIDHPMPTEPDFGQYGARGIEDNMDLGSIVVGNGLPEDIRQSVIRRQRQTERLRSERRAGRL